MKMQNEIQCPHAGTVTAVHVEQGQRVEQGGLLVEYDPAG
jgi:biotin carboxyl carrier protein